MRTIHLSVSFLFTKYKSVIVVLVISKKSKLHRRYIEWFQSKNKMCSGTFKYWLFKYFVVIYTLKIVFTKTIFNKKKVLCLFIGRYSREKYFSWHIFYSYLKYLFFVYRFYYTYNPFKFHISIFLTYIHKII